MKKERLIVTLLLMLSVLLIQPIRSNAAENESEEEFAVDIPDTGYSLRLSGTFGRVTEIYDFSDTQVPVFAYYVGDSYRWIYIGYASGGDVHMATRNDLASGFLDSYRYEYIYTDNGTVKTHDVYSTDGNHRTASNTPLSIQFDTAYMFDELEGYLFDSLEAARSYFYGGDETGLINAPEINVPLMNGLYDDSMPGVDNFTVKTLSAKDCHGSIDNFNMCLGLRWSKPTKWTSGDSYAIYVDLAYNYNTYWSTQRKYGSATMVNVSDFFDSPILIDSLAVDLCAHDFAESVPVSLVNSFDRVTSFTVENVSKIYIQSVRVSDGKTYHGDWYVFKVNKDGSLSANYNKQDIGTGEIIQGTIDPDTTGYFSDDAVKKGEIAAPPKDDTAGFAGLDFSDLSGAFSTFSRILENLMGALGSFPSLFATVFQFLPYELNSAIVFLFYLAVIVGLIRIFT